MVVNQLVVCEECSWKIVSAQAYEHAAGHRARTKHQRFTFEPFEPGHPTMKHEQAEAAGHCGCHEKKLLDKATKFARDAHDARKREKEHAGKHGG